MTHENIKNALHWRYAVKKYDTAKKIGADDWDLLKKSLVLAPSSYGLQPWKFLVIQNAELRKKLRVFSWDQSIIEDCSHLVVFTTLKEMTAEHVNKHIQNTAHARHIQPETLDGYKKFMEQKILREMDKAKHLGWNQRQAYIAMGFLLETAALIHIDSTPIEGLQPEKYDELLGLHNSNFTAVAAVALGYRHKDDGYQSSAKSRFAENEIIEIIS